MIVAIVGSRPPKTGESKWMLSAHRIVRARIAELADGTIILTGGARGVDALAAQIGRRYGFDVRIYPAEWDRYGRAAGPMRNARLVADADSLLAFWDGESAGTQNAIKQARALGKPCELILLPPGG